MSEMILVYVTCENVEQAKSIGKHLMEKRLCACVNIFPNMQPMFWWPPHANKIDESTEVVLLVKSLESKYQEIEDEIHKIHTYELPCVFAWKVDHVSPKYYEWIKGEVKE